MSGQDKHTPGPWSVVMVNTSQGPMPTIAVPLGSAFRPLVSGLYASIPVVTNAADAHLMALAPDLLAALRQWQMAFDHLFSHCLSNGVFNADGEPADCSYLNAAADSTRAALAKATGAAE